MGWNKAFTLVELIVVITILAILATVGFISFQWYTSQSRDSVRISDMKIVEKALVLNNVTSGNYPAPGNIDASVTHWKQWEVSNEVLKKLQWITQVPVDPLTKTPMRYATTLDSKQFQLKYDLEAISQWNIYQIYAQNIAHKITWNYNGLFLVWNDNVYYSSIWLHSSGSTFYINSGIAEFNVEKLQNSSNTDITPENIENNYPDFSLALIEKYENNANLESNWKQELLSLDRNNEYELAQFAIKILWHNPQNLEQFIIDNPDITVPTNPDEETTPPSEWTNPPDWGDETTPWDEITIPWDETTPWKCIDSTTPTDAWYFDFDESTWTITTFNPKYGPTIKNLVIPCEINWVKVEHIGNWAIWRKGIESLVLSENIKTIWSDSFSVNNLTSIIFHSDVILNSNAFTGQNWNNNGTITASIDFCNNYFNDTYFDIIDLTSCSQ